MTAKTRKKRKVATNTTDETMLEHYIKLYGPTMELNQAAKVLHYSVGHLRNLVCVNRAPVPFYKVGRFHIVDTRDIVKYLENMKAEAI